jgi:hypothetical protein
MDPAGHLDPEEGAEGGGQSTDGQDQEGRADRALFGLGPEALPLHDEQGEHAVADQ